MAEHVSESSGGKGAPSRRKFFLITGWSSLGLFLSGAGAAFARYFYPGVLYEPQTTFNAGRPEEYVKPVNPTEVVVDERFKSSQRVWIVRSSKGVYAMVGVCTHLGCTPNWFPGEQRFKCPCHGSNYNVEGEVVAGPAPLPLFRAKIKLAPDGSMIITTGLLGIKRPELQYKKSTLLPRWTDEEKIDIAKAPYFLEIKA
ncbi:MAG: Rieske 2Fe-2S domain-containing protein [Nitrospinae bacterium]|nr:Rieske 2Fe-2S domain-containing protein [Nitrospinota bacterium]